MSANPKKYNLNSKTQKTGLNRLLPTFTVISPLSGANLSSDDKFNDCNDKSYADLAEDYNAMTIYLSPIPVSPPQKGNCKCGEDGFQSTHQIEFPKQEIEYFFTHDEHHQPEWKVTNPYYDVVNDNENYVLGEFHMHYPAEHLVNGVRYPLELHFLFPDPTNISNAFVLGFLFQIGCKSSKIIRQIMDNCHVKLPHKIDNDFCTYNGSLTKINLEDIRPLAVNWNLITKVKTITQEDLNFLINNHMVRAASPSRDSNGRNINYIHRCNHCHH